MNPIASLLTQTSLIILDGALATELERAGADLDDPLWSAKVLLEAPECIKAVHTDYLAAGADCLITASYQATLERLTDRGLSRNQAVDLIRLSIQLAVEARDEFWADPVNRVGRFRPLVAASIGPYGAYLADGSEYRGDYGLTQQALIEFHRPRLTILAATEADMLACETIPCLVEAQALVHLLAEFPERYAWVTFTAKDAAHISQGERFVDCVRWLDNYPQIAAIGVNCTAPKYLPPLIETAKTTTQKPIIVYPNSGEGYSTTNKSWTGSVSYDNYGGQAEYWYHCGASIIGGCCRTTPADIAQIAAWFRSTGS